MDLLLQQVGSGLRSGAATDVQVLGHGQVGRRGVGYTGRLDDQTGGHEDQLSHDATLALLLVMLPEGVNIRPKADRDRSGVCDRRRSPTSPEGVDNRGDDLPGIDAQLRAGLTLGGGEDVRPP